MNKTNPQQAVGAPLERQGMPSWQSVCINCAHLDRRGPMGEEWHCAAVTVGRNRVYAVTARSANNKRGRCGPDAKLFAPAKA